MSQKLFNSNCLKKLIQYRSSKNIGLYKFSNPFLKHQTTLSIDNKTPFITNYWNYSYILLNHLYDQQNFTNLKQIDNLFYELNETTFNSNLQNIKTDYIKLITRLHIRNTFLEQINQNTYLHIDLGNVFVLPSIEDPYCYGINTELTIQDLRTY